MLLLDLVAGLSLEIPVLVAVGVALFVATSAIAIISRLGVLPKPR